MTLLDTLRYSIPKTALLYLEALDQSGRRRIGLENEDLGDGSDRPKSRRPLVVADEHLFLEGVGGRRGRGRVAPTYDINNTKSHEK